MKTKKFFGKRVLSLLLILLMVLSLMPLSVFSTFAADSDNLIPSNFRPRVLSIADNDSDGYQICHQSLSGIESMIIEAGAENPQYTKLFAELYDGHDILLSGYWYKTSAGGPIVENDFSNNSVFYLDTSGTVSMTGGNIFALARKGYPTQEVGKYSDDAVIDISGGKVGILAGIMTDAGNKTLNADVDIKVTNATVGSIYGGGNPNIYSGGTNNVNRVTINGDVIIDVADSTVNSIYNVDFNRGSVHNGNTYIRVLDSTVGNIYVGSKGNGIHSAYINSGKLNDTGYFTNLIYLDGKNWIVKGDLDAAANGADIVVAEGQTMTLSSGITGATSIIVNYGNLILEDGSSVNKIENYGTVTTRGELNVKTLNNYATVDYTGTPGPNTYVYNAVGSKFFCHGDHDGLNVNNDHTGSNWSIFYCESTDCTSTPNGWYYGIVDANFYTSYLTITEKKGNFCWMNEFSCRFVPESEYMVLPKTIRVEENDGYKSTVLEEGKHYSYDPYTGEFVFFKHVADYAEIRIYCYAGPKDTLNISGNNPDNFTTVEIEETRYLYDGTAKTPAIKSITHTSYGTETELKEGEDYTYTYTNNVEAGTGYVVITGKNWYNGTIRVPFEIYQLELKGRVYGEDYCEVTLENDSFTYNAMELEPEVSEVKYYTYNESEAVYSYITLTEGVDYTVSYKNNVEPGEGTVVVTGIGKYKGEVSTTFEIGKAPISHVTITGNVSAYDGTDQSLNVTLTHNGVVLTKGVDYELRYTQGAIMHYPGDTLTVQVWGIGDRYKSSTSFEWKIVEADLEGLEYSIFRNGESLVYNGLPQTPKKWLVRVTTTSGVDCLCYGNWSSVTNVGDSITFTSTSSIFSGTVEFTENLMSQADIATVTAYDKQNRVYTGEEQTVDLKAYLGFGDYYLEEGKDYTLEGETSATEPGEYTVTLKGMGNFKGEQTVTWRINPINIKESEVTVDNVPSFTYDGDSHVLDTVLYYTYPNGTKAEIPGTWNEIKNVSDTAVFTVDSESPYFYGTYEIENVIQKLDITDLAEFPETCDYTGYTQSLSATLKGFDYFTYSVKYNEEPVNAGTYTATITGTGNFTGTVERTFEVLPAKLSVNIYIDTKYYDGTTDVEVSRVNLLGVRADDDVTMDYSDLEVILPSADAGVYKTAEIKGISLAGEDIGNYTFDASEGVALKGYYGGDFRISARQLIINAEDQRIDSGETPDQSMWYCDSVPDGFTVSDIVLTANEEELRVVPSGGVVTEDSTGRDVTHNFWFDYSWGYLTLNCTNHTPDDNGFCSNCGGYEAAKLNDNGTPEEDWDDYYEISNAGQLYWYAEQVNAYYSSANAVLVDDIVVNEDLTAENLREWTPIGSGSPAFVADFDGQGHTISGLYCNLDRNYVGFFGYSDYNYPISNLGIKDSYFEGNNYVGAFAGYASSAISNCFVENVEVVCNGYNGADFVGYNGGYIENCYSASDSFVYRNYGSITNSYYLADEDIHEEDGLTFKTAEQFASGEVAYLLQAGIAEEDIYDDEWNYIETIIPEIWGQKIGEDNYPVLGGDKVYYVTNCKDENIYSNTNENGQHNFVDGECTVCGKVCQHTWEDSKCTICGKVCEHNWEDSKCTVCGKVCEHNWDDGECTICGKACEHNWEDGKCTICGKECEHNWIDSECTICGKVCQHTEYENGFCTGCDIFEPATYNEEDNVYEISNAGQLYWFADKVNNDNANFGSANVILTADIVVNEGVMTAETTGAREWIPIGNYDYGYDGTFDGNDHTVSGIYYNNNETSYIGLVGFVDKRCIVKNTGVINSYFYGGNYVGGVAGVNYGTITNCYNTGTVCGYRAIGGVVGDNLEIITNCYNTGVVSGDISIGGVIGANAGTTKNCYNTGVASGSSNIGGVVGTNDDTITNCYSTGVVSGSTSSGGVVGANYGTITNCYSTGGVSGIWRIGGVVGTNNGTTINCYYLDTAYAGGIGTSDSADAEDAAGSAEAKTAEAFASGEVAYLLQGEQTEEIWGQKIGEDNYPVLGGDKVYVKTDAEGNTVYSNEAAEEKTDKLAGYDISLKGNIALNFYFALTEEALADENAKVVFTFADGDTSEIFVKDAAVSGNYYAFTCEVPAKEMADEVKAQLITSKGEGEAYSYSVQKYAEYIINEAEKAQENAGGIAGGGVSNTATPEQLAYVKAAPLAKAMLNYGAYAQRNFGYNTDNPANENLDEAEMKLPDSVSFDNWKHSVSGQQEGVSFYGAALSLKSETAIKLYFAVDSDVDVNSLDVTVNGEAYTLKKNGTLYELKIADIPAHRLGDMYEVKVGSLTVNYGVFSYGCTVMEGDNAKLKDTIKALAVYHEEACNYAS